MSVVQVDECMHRLIQQLRQDRNREKYGYWKVAHTYNTGVKQRGQIPMARWHQLPPSCGLHGKCPASAGGLLQYVKG